MSGKDVLLKAINREKTPRQPVAVMSGGAWTYNNNGYALKDILDQPELAAQLIIETNEKWRSDVVWAGSGFNNLPVRAAGGKIRFRKKGAPDIVEPLLKSAADIARIDLDRVGEDSGVQNLWKVAGLLNKALGDKNLIGASGWGPFSLAAQMYGVEKMLRDIYNDKPSVHAALEFSSELSFRYYEGFIKAGVQLLSIAEPTASGDLISREHFAEFVVPHLKKFVDRVKQTGVYTMLHICGNITKSLDLIPEIGVEVLSVDYKVDIAKVREVIGSKLAFAGNLNPVAVLEDASPEEVSAVARDCLSKAGDDTSYILMPGCDLSPGVPLANIQAMIDTGLSWRQ